MRRLTNDAARETPLFATIGAVIALLIGASAMGQQAPVSSVSDNPELHEIVVTGSTIKRPNAETAQAVTIVCRPSGKHIIAAECDRPSAGAIRDRRFCRDYRAEPAFSSGLTFQGSRASSSVSVVARGSCS